MASKQNKRVKNLQNRYRPGTLTKLSCGSTATRSFTDVGKKRVVLNSDKAEMVQLHKAQLSAQSILPFTSPIRTNFCSPIEEAKHQKPPATPKTPKALEYAYDSILESLPMDLLVKILCHLHHDQLRAVFHVSQKIRTAVIQARQLHFNYTTPDRSRQKMLSSKKPLETELGSFVSKGDGKGSWGSTPDTPKAPKHCPHPPRPHLIDLKEIAAVLFPEGTLPSRCMVTPGLSRPVCKSVVSPRVLF